MAFVYPSSREHTTLAGRGFGTLFFLVSATLALEFIKKYHGSTGGDDAQQEQLWGPRSVVVDSQLLEDRFGPWFKLADSDKAAQLHRKFWRRSMVSEEAEWRGTQKSVGDDPGDVSDGEVDPMDVDMDEEEEDEIGPECYILNIGIKGLPHSKIWIRTDYIRIYDYCSGHYESCLSQPSRWVAPSIIITGQPGVGKSSFRVRNFRLIWQREKGSQSGSITLYAGAFLRGSQ